MDNENKDDKELEASKAEPVPGPDRQQTEAPKADGDSAFVDSPATTKESVGEKLKKHKTAVTIALAAFVVAVVAVLFGTKVICFHNWEDATCIHPKTCSNCGLTEGESLGHQLGDYEVIREATCTEVGTERAQCKVCQTYVNREIPMVDHTPGKWEVSLKPSISSDGTVEEGTKVRKCTVCGQVIDSQTYTLSAEEIKAEFKKGCKEYSYKKIFRNPDDYEGKQAKFTGKVVQVQEASGLYVLRVATSGNYDDVIYVIYSTDSDASRILEDDKVTIYGTLAGLETYETVMGGSVTIPKVNASYVDIK